MSTITGKYDDNVNMNGKVCLITGANTGLGLQTAKVLAKNGAHVIMAVRSLERGQQAVEQIQSEYPSANITVMSLNLSDFDNVNQFVNEFEQTNLPLHVLVNNAGIAKSSSDNAEEKSIEDMYKTNHLGHFLLTKKLLPKLIRDNTEADPGRIVIVSSEAHTFVKKLTVDDVERFTQNPIVHTSFTMVQDCLNQYGFTKLCNLYQMYALNEELQRDGVKSVTVNAIHPGAVKTELNRDVQNLPFFQRVILSPIIGVAQRFFFKDVVEGAQTQIYAACSPDMLGVSGLYLSDCKEARTTDLARNVEVRAKLIDLTLQQLHQHL